MAKPNKPTLLSLYSGAGGMDYGFQLAGFESIFANDFDKFAVSTFNGLVDGGHAICADVETLDLSGFRGVDVVAGGPPCQGFSVAGKMNPDDPRSRHVWIFLQTVALLMPQVFVMENVKHLAVNDRWSDIRDGLRNAAERLGYTTTLIVLRASHYGVPQNRDRMFLIGALGSAIATPPKTTAQHLPTSREALHALPKFGDAGNDSFCTAEITLASNPVLRKSPFAGMLFNGAGRPINLDAPAQTLAASMGGNKTPIIDQRWMDGAAKSWVVEYHDRLWNGGKPLGMREVPDYLRRLTVEEAAIIQSFPTGMEWSGGRSAQFRQIGNAVPPRLAFAVAKAIFTHLRKNDRVRRDGHSMTIEDLIDLGQDQLSLKL